MIEATFSSGECAKKQILHGKNLKIMIIKKYNSHSESKRLATERNWRINYKLIPIAVSYKKKSYERTQKTKKQQQQKINIIQTTCERSKNHPTDSVRIRKALKGPCPV